MTAGGTGRPVQVCAQGDLCPGTLRFNGRASCDGPRPSCSVAQVSEPETVGAAPQVRESALSSDPEPRGVQRGPWGLSPGEVWDEMDLKGALMILSFEHLFFC